MTEDQETNMVVALSRIETKLDRVLTDHDELEVEVQANTRFRWRATAVGSACVALLGWLGLK